MKLAIVFIVTPLVGTHIAAATTSIPSTDVHELVQQVIEAGITEDTAMEDPDHHAMLKDWLQWIDPDSLEVFLHEDNGKCVRAIFDQDEAPFTELMEDTLNMLKMVKDLVDEGDWIPLEDLPFTRSAGESYEEYIYSEDYVQDYVRDTNLPNSTGLGERLNDIWTAIPIANRTHWDSGALTIVDLIPEQVCSVAGKSTMRQPIAPFTPTLVQLSVPVRPLRSATDTGPDTTS